MFFAPSTISVTVASCTLAQATVSQSLGLPKQVTVFATEIITESSQVRMMYAHHVQGDSSVQEEVISPSVYEAFTAQELSDSAVQLAATHPRHHLPLSTAHVIKLITTERPLNVFCVQQDRIARTANGLHVCHTLTVWQVQSIFATALVRMASFATSQKQK